MPLDRGRELPSDADDSALAPLAQPVALTQDPIVRRRFVAKPPGNLVPDDNQAYRGEPVRNAYEATILEDLGEFRYKVYRQDMRIGFAKSKATHKKFRVGATVTIVRPQEKEDENDWYIVTEPTEERFPVIQVSVDSDPTGKINFTSISEDEVFSTVDESVNVNDFISIQGSKLKFKKGGVYQMVFNLDVLNMEIDDSGGLAILLEDCPAAVYSNANTTVTPGVSRALLYDRTSSGTWQRTNREIEIESTVRELLEAGLIVQFKIMAGKYVIDVVECNA